jgi:hypothetical protein
MTSLNRQDADLHYPDGSHRSTPPSANGQQVTLWHTRLTQHLASHEVSASMASHEVSASTPGTLVSHLSSKENTIMPPDYDRIYRALSAAGWDEADQPTSEQIDVILAAAAKNEVIR